MASTNIKEDMNRLRIGRVQQGTTGRERKVYDKSKIDLFDERHLENNLDFRKVTSRRQFFDLIKDYVDSQQTVTRKRLTAHLQYTTGASYITINEAIDVLHELGLIIIEEKEISPTNYSILIKSIKGEAR